MKLSIIMPVYNLEDSVEESIRSVLENGIIDEYELIVIDDGSTDSSYNVINELYKTKNHIVLIKNENNGVSNARNTGIENAKGEYIAFIDGDDTIEKGVMQKAINDLESEGYDFVQFGYREVNEETGEIIAAHQPKRDEVLCCNQKMLEAFVSNKKTIYNACWGKVYKSNIVKRVLFDESLCVAEDQKFTFDIIRNSSTIKLYNQIGYNYYRRKKSVSYSLDRSKYKDCINVMNYIINNAELRSARTKVSLQRIDVLLSMYNSELVELETINNNVLEDIRSIDLISLCPTRYLITILKALLLTNCNVSYNKLLKLKKLSTNRRSD